MFNQLVQNESVLGAGRLFLTNAMLVATQVPVADVVVLVDNVDVLLDDVDVLLDDVDVLAILLLAAASWDMMHKQALLKSIGLGIFAKGLLE